METQELKPKVKKALNLKKVDITYDQLNEFIETLNIDYYDLVGVLFGYPIESRTFYIKEVSADSGNIGGIKGAYDRISEGVWENFLQSGFRGTGYISTPEELLAIKKGSITSTQIIKGINSRRFLSTNFPREQPKVTKSNPEKDASTFFAELDLSDINNKPLSRRELYLMNKLKNFLEERYEEIQQEINS